MNVKIRKLHADAQVPAYATAGAAGFDLVAVEDVVIEPGETKKIPLGLAFELPEGYELQVRPRSGISINTRLRVILGTVDADYRGEVAVLMENNMPPHYSGSTDAVSLDNTEWVDVGERVTIGTYFICKGDRIAQGIIVPIARAAFTVTDELSETERGDGGFGHTGTKSEEAQV